MYEEIKTRYPYLYETHLHTLEASACAHSGGREMARACKEYGYTGIFVTDHNWGGNTAIDRSKPWEEWVNDFCTGYENAKDEGDKIGLDVFFGYEAGFSGTEFLIYGIDKEWMLNNPDILNADIEGQYKLIHQSGGMVIHAHPCREAGYISQVRLFPELVDGVEGINGAHSSPRSMGHNNPDYDKRAIAYATKHKLPMTAGSDIHCTELFGAGVAFKRRLESAKDYINAVLSGEDYVLTDGECWYDKSGKRL